jgi:hypothetical protein
MGNAVRRLCRSRRTAVVLIAALAALGVGLPVAALATSSPVVYYACVANKTGAIRIVSKSARCPAHQRKISWDRTGPQGPPGPTGVVAGYTADSTSPIPLGTSATTVLTLSLPSGSYILNAQVNAYPPSGDVDYVLCYVEDASGELTWGRVTAGYPAETLALTGATKVGGTVSLDCLYNPVSGTGAPSAYGTFMTAVPVSTVSGSLSTHFPGDSSRSLQPPPLRPRRPRSD